MHHRILWQKPRLHEDPAQHRKVSWLELFFDLVFVVVISELVHLLSSNPTLGVIGNYLFLFVPAWWIWIGATYYNDRFETDGFDNRIFTFLLMLPVAGLAIFAHEISSVGYGLCYTLARTLIVAMWLRASVHEPRFRPVGRILIGGYTSSILLFIVSLFCDTPVRFALWVIALACDLVTPVFTLKRQTKLPHFNLSKLPERLGLFVLIVIGEGLVGIIRGVARHHHFSFRVVSEGITGIAISFALWWIYFDFVANRVPKAQHRDTFLWSYLHLIFVMGIGAVAASLLHILTSKHHIPTDSVRYLMTGSLAVSVVFMGLIELVLQKEENEFLDRKISVGLKFLAAFLLLLLGGFGQGLQSFTLLAGGFVTLLLPIGYGAYAWVIERVKEPAS